MKRISRILLLALLLLAPAWSSLHAQEHSFGLRAGTLQFAESSILGDAVQLDRRPTVVIDYNRTFESGDFDGVFIEGTYEWRRDTDAHVSVFVGGGVYSESATRITGGTAEVTDSRGSGGTWLVGQEPNTSFANTNTLEYAIYYFHFSPRWNFTTGKARFWVGAGLGLWANMWREVVDARYTDVFSCDRIENPSPRLENCKSEVQYRESDGNRRSTVPLSASAGFTYQFLPHWSLNIEDRYVFNATGSINLFRTDSSFEITGNEILFGFAYKL